MFVGVMFKILNKFKLFEDHRIWNFSSNIDLRKRVFLCAEKLFIHNLKRPVFNSFVKITRNNFHWINSAWRMCLQSGSIHLFKKTQKKIQKNQLNSQNTKFCIFVHEILHFQIIAYTRDRIIYMSPLCHLSLSNDSLYYSHLFTAHFRIFDQ